MIQIETPPLAKPEQSETINVSENDLKMAKEKILEQEKLLLEAKEKNKPKPELNPEQLIKEALNSKGEIHKYVLQHILKLNDIDTNLKIGSLIFRKVYLGDGWYRLLS